jgi:hypothetical protein
MQSKDHESERSYRNLKRTLQECREQLERIESMLTKSKQDNDPRN